MLTYKGKNLESGLEVVKEFEDETESINHARENCSSYPKYVVFNENGDIVDSDMMAKGDEDASLDAMYPDGKSDEDGITELDEMTGD